MAITALRMTPEIPAVGQSVTVTPVGTPSGELRYYLLSAPPSSGLSTLATYEEEGKALADIRLSLTGSNQATFTPDAPGQYTVVVRDVTVYRFVPSYGGEVPAAGDPASADNEEEAFTVDGNTTAQVSDFPPSGQEVWCYEVVSRQIGFGQDTATLSIAAVEDEVVDHTDVPEPVTLAPGQTAPSKVAAYDAAVLRAVQSVEELTFGSGQIASHSDILAELVEAFNEHIGLQQWKVHTNADATNTLASTSDVSATLAAIGTRLDDIVAKFNAHRVLTAGPVHVSADNSNVMTAGSVATLADAIAYYEHVYRKLYFHCVTPSFHDTSTPNEIVDGYLGWLAEPPTTLSNLAQALNGTEGTRWENYGLTWLYERHIGRVLHSAHYGSGLGPDAENVVLFLGGTPSNLYATANALADALTRHIRNQDALGNAAATPYHYTDAKKSRIPVRRASDARSLAVCIEELWLCMESHLWSAGPPSYTTNTTASERGQHPDRVWGLASYEAGGDIRPTPLIRLQKAFERALVPGSNVTAAVGKMAGRLRTEAGFT